MTKDEPYLVKGGVPVEKENIVRDEDGTPLKYESGGKIEADETYCLCQCGQSKNKPFCDVSHIAIDFKD